MNDLRKKLEVAMEKDAFEHVERSVTGNYPQWVKESQYWAYKLGAKPRDLLIEEFAVALAGALELLRWKGVTQGKRVLTAVKALAKLEAHLAGAEEKP